MAKLSELVNDIETNDTAVLSNDSPPVDVNPIDELQTLLAGYSKPATVIETPGEKPAESQPVQSPPPVQPNGSPHWYGNPLYYQSGKKQGQLKPPPKKSIFAPPHVSVNTDTTSTIGGDVITGALFLSMVNLLLPMLFSLIHNMIVKDKRKRIDYEHLQLPDKDIRQLETLADKALKHIKIEANPVAVLIFAMVGMYGMQFATVKMLTDAHVKTDTKK